LHGSFSAYQWQFVDNVTRQNSWRTGAEVPAVTEEAVALSKDLKRRGFTFVGPTIMYAHMQAVGMVNDHTTNCFSIKRQSASVKATLTPPAGKVRVGRSLSGPDYRFIG